MFDENEDFFNEWWEDDLALKSYTADFETTTDMDDCRVWAFACCEIDNPENVDFGTSINDFMAWCELHANCQLYFHNLAFDGNFLINHLERSGWQWVESPANAEPFTYTTCISDMNAMYSITLFFRKAFKVRIYDSLKIIPLSVKNMARAFDLPIEKGELDYKAYRAPGHELTEDEKTYIRYDVQIAAMAMATMLGNGMSKMTAGANALADFKQMMGGHKGFRKVFPVISAEDDMFMRRAYRGGFTYCDPRFQGREVGVGEVFDVNSLYPSVMAGCEDQLLPYGVPTWFDGSPFGGGAVAKKKPLWIASVTCTFKIKPEHIPCIQIKGNMRFKPEQYLLESNGEVELMLTNVDWELYNAHYDIKVLSWNGGFRFQGRSGLFKGYVDKWTAVKVQAGHEGNAGMRQLAKLQLNSLYGKMATRITGISRRPVLKDGIVRYVDLPEEEREPVYLPAGIFITSWARYKTVTSAQKCYDRFAYADTDSLHLVGEGVPDCLDVDDFELGKWAHESTFDNAKFLRAKCYIERERGKDKLTVHVAGLPAVCHAQVTFDNFEFGAVYEGKLYQKRTEGGIVLVEGDMMIREVL